MTFHNTEVCLSDLPHLSDIEFKKVDNKFAQISLGSSLVQALVLILFVFIAVLMFHEVRTYLVSFPGNLLMVVGLLILAWLVLVTWLSAKVIRYALREHDLVLRSGIFWKSETIQPLPRVQHVALTSGPLDKHFGLANLQIFSAGTGHSTFTIPGLSLRDAEKIRLFVLSYSGSNQAEANSFPTIDQSGCSDT